MKKLALLFGLLFVSPAFAADNAVIVTPGTGLTMKSKDVGSGVQAMQPILSDTSGAPIYGIAGTANANILTVQGIASMTPLLATITGTVTANQGGAWNITNVSGTVSLPTGASTAANQATELTSLATIATNTGAAIPAGSAVIGGVKVYDGGGTNQLAVNGSGQAAVQAPPSLPLPTGAATAANQTADPCSLALKTNLPISFQATASAQLIALSGSTKIYVCSLSLIASVATNFSLTGGTGTNCGTPAALIGTTTASNGVPLAANGGLTLGNGAGTVAVTGAGSELCIVQSGAGNIVGNLTYVQQ